MPLFAIFLILLAFFALRWVLGVMDTVPRTKREAIVQRAVELGVGLGSLLVVLAVLFPVIMFVLAVTGVMP